MNLSKHIRETRRDKFKSVRLMYEKITNEHIEFKIPEASYYAIERGLYIPSLKDLDAIIDLLELDTKKTILLWLNDQLLPHQKKFFPLPETMQEQKMYELNPDNLMVINFTHIQYFVKNRLPRMLLLYFYINPNDKLTQEQVAKQFTKHTKKNIVQELKTLVGFGYLKEENGIYQARTKQLYFPKETEMIELTNEILADLLKTSAFQQYENEYGKYRSGFKEFGLRTFTPDQVDFINKLMKQTFSEIRSSDKKAGQEYFYLLALGAIDEK